MSKKVEIESENNQESTSVMNAEKQELELEHKKQQDVLVQQNQPATAQTGAWLTDEPEYRMNKKKRGYALIINNTKFAPQRKMSTREGSEKDVKSLQDSLEKLEFNIEVCLNCTKEQMNDKINKYSKDQDHSDADCFVCVLMSHGSENGFISAVDEDLELDSLINPFKSNQSLAGKPKLFFIQACRGDKPMPSTDTMPYSDEVSKIPIEADFLVVYSTCPGYCAILHTQNGSWFIQSLCHLLDEYADKLEIMRILTVVNRKVAMKEPQTYDSTLEKKKQVPCIVSMLTKELYFRPKNANKAVQAE